MPYKKIVATAPFSAAASSFAVRSMKAFCATRALGVRSGSCSGPETASATRSAQLGGMFGSTWHLLFLGVPPRSFRDSWQYGQVPESVTACLNDHFRLMTFDDGTVCPSALVMRNVTELSESSRVNVAAGVKSAGAGMMPGHMAGIDSVASM